MQAHLKVHPHYFGELIGYLKVPTLFKNLKAELLHYLVNCVCECEQERDI